jgi:serine/threonine-protein kinase RsbT
MQQLERPVFERVERVSYAPNSDARRATFPISGAGDATIARQYARFFAERTGFTRGDQIVIDAVLGEMATNVLSFAGKGEFVFGTENNGGRTGIVIVVRDRGPGIPDVQGALVDGYSTSGRPGLGLAASRRLMDSFHVASAPGEGTTITMKKWRDAPG